MIFISREKNTTENGIPKARRFILFDLSVSDTLTDEERALFNAYDKTSNKNDKEIMRNLYHEKIKSFTGTRTIEHKKLYQEDGSPCLNKVIAGFENEAVRLCDSFVFNEDNPKQIPLITEYMIMDCKNLLILEQIIERGVMIDGCKYFVYSSSTNQQKNKQICLMQEKFFNENKSKLLCGLTLDIINSKGGCNTGKYLAYTSLVFSKSVESEYQISIDEVIVLPEFETYVMEKVNYLDMDTQKIKEKTMSVPVNHMDGAGMFLPNALPQSAQIRGGYIKGCVFPFDFRQFIIKKQEDGKIPDDAVILDAWGNPVSVSYIRDNIKMILNDSQLKMRKYYSSWDEYKEKFKENQLKICINNALHYPKTDNPLTMSAYQFYQTIPRKNVTGEKIEKLCKNTIEIINDYKTNGNAVLEILGVDDDEKELEAFHAVIKSYPDMVCDPYVRSKVESKIKNIRKKGMAGKPFIQGFYNYICPDLYAACEHWFCGESNPQGLIPKNHVYNGFYNDKDVDEVCCLRSPHLSDCEHGIRSLVKSDECERWFHGMDTVISVHDLLVYTLVCDNDGDECLITHDRAFIDLLDRNKLPMYYEMKKAEPLEINGKNIFECLKRSFENSQIGKISNVLTKYLNQQDEPDLNFVRVMTSFNNHCIDYPKSQYMPVLNEDYRKIYDELSDRQCLYPYFFKYAKDKDSDQCEEYQKNEKSNVNRISKHIMLHTRKNTDNIWKDMPDEKGFRPEYLQLKDYKVNRISNTYKELQKELIRLKALNNNKFRKKLKEQYENNLKISSLGYEPFYCYCNQRIRSIVEAEYKIGEGIGIRKKAAEYLLDIEYFQEENRNKSNKDILWNCFGDILFDNLKTNLQLEENGQKVKIKRNAYQSAETKQLEKARKAEEVAKEISKTYDINITKAEMEYVLSIPCRKNSENDRYLLYMLLVEYKRKLAFLERLENQEAITDDNKKHFRIYRNARYGKLTRATLDKRLGKNVVAAKRGLERLEKNKLIKIVSCNKNGERYDKIYPLFVSNIVSDSETAFVAKNSNPMFDLYLYDGVELNKKVKLCEVCGKPYYPERNEKTCSPSCSRLLELENKNKKAS